MFEVKVESSICIMKIECEISYSNMQTIKEKIEANIKEEYNGYILNFEICTYINSSAFEYLVELYKRLKNEKKRLVFCSMVPDVYELFNITRLHKIIDICKNEKEAITAMNSKK